MDGRSSSHRIALLAVPAIVVAAAMATARPPARGPAQKNAAAPAIFVGAEDCSGCHNNRLAPNPAYDRSKKHIRRDEFEIWKRDKHGSAYENLEKSKLAKEMGRRLGNLDVTDRKTGCLGCHSASVEEVNHRQQGKAFKASDGVSCENCHGAAGDWVGPHFTDPTWREKSPKEKAERGMTDLRDPVLQSSKCLSCHVGSVAEGKVVTHEMYAVGHPPLPSIEVSRFADEMRHWWLIKEKPESKDDLKLLKGNEFERSRLSLVAASIALKTAMTQIVEESGVEQPPAPGESWPDYARFDCASCHHELQRPSWRQERGFTLTPGRPPIGRWPIETVRLGIEKLALDDPSAKGLLAELDAHEAAINAATSVRPFGRKAALKDAASKYAEWSKILADRLGKATYDEKSVKELLRKLLVTANGDLDYDSARHVVWTAWSLYRDLQPDGMGDEGLRKKDAEVKALFAQISKGLNLDLPIGRNERIAEGLPDALRRMADYDPAQFRKDMMDLRDKLLK
jgi:hypothetical protein